MSYISFPNTSDFLESCSVSTTPTPTSPTFEHSPSLSQSSSSSSSLTSSPSLNHSPIVITTTTTTSTSPSKLRQIAPAPVSNNEYDNDDNEQPSEFEVYHIPKGYEVLLVPRDDSNMPANVLATTKRISPATAADNLKIQQQKSSTSSVPSNGSNSSSWRRRKQNGHIPRPKNCFMAYREHIQHEILSQNPGMNNKYVSVVAAEKWNKESEETKNYWREKAHLLKIEHGLKYPNYKFAPKKKQPKTASASNNDSSDDVISVKSNKAIKKSPSNSNKVLTEDMARNLLSTNNSNEDKFSFENNGFIVADNNIWNHYRSSSVESIGSMNSWTSGESSTSPSTPSLNDYNHNNYSNERSSSPLRFEACVDNNDNNTVNLNDLVINNDQLTSSFQPQVWNGVYDNSLSSTSTELQNDFYALDLPTTFNYHENMPIDYYNDEYDFIDHHNLNNVSSQQQLFNINQQHQQQQQAFY